MLQTLHILTLLLAALVVTTTLAHALEWPGKLRLDEAAYRQVQTIFYPGFTRAGIAEPLAIVASGALLAFTPAGTLRFWLILGALAAFALVHLTYWARTHKVNKVWTKDLALKTGGARFFGEASDGAEPPWTELRDRWERSHAVRAALALIGFLLLAGAVTV